MDNEDRPAELPGEWQLPTRPTSRAEATSEWTYGIYINQFSPYALMAFAGTIVLLKCTEI